MAGVTLWSAGLQRPGRIPLLRLPGAETPMARVRRSGRGMAQTIGNAFLESFTMGS